MASPFDDDAFDRFLRSAEPVEGIDQSVAAHPEPVADVGSPDGAFYAPDETDARAGGGTP